jgi:hypothetical protein
MAITPLHGDYRPDTNSCLWVDFPTIRKLGLFGLFDYVTECFLIVMLECVCLDVELLEGQRLTRFLF